MIPEIVNNYLNLIRNGSNVNSYKLAWARAIVEICAEADSLETISIESIAKKIFKYYWNQTIYFELNQGNNPNKRPEFLKIVRRKIKEFYLEKGNSNPIHFERVEDKIILDKSKLVSILKKDVSWRFLNLNGNKLEVYNYKKGQNYLYINNSHELASYDHIIYECINLKWTQLLEEYNTSPRISKKIRIIDFPQIKRKSLSKFKEILLLQNPEKVCFICNKEISDDQLSIDHFIPWSFMYSDDIWNLVYTHKICNSSKSNSSSSDKQLKKLEERNNDLLKEMKLLPKMVKKKEYHELENAIEKDYLKKFWINFRN